MCTSELNVFASRSQSRSKLSMQRNSSLTGWRSPRMQPRRRSWRLNSRRLFTLLLWCFGFSSHKMSPFSYIFKINVHKTFSHSLQLYRCQKYVMCNFWISRRTFAVLLFCVTSKPPPRLWFAALRMWSTRWRRCCPLMAWPGTSRYWI